MTLAGSASLDDPAQTILKQEEALIRRLCEAGARTLPFMALLLIPILLGMTTLYVWARPGAAHDANRRDGVQSLAVLGWPRGQPVVTGAGAARKSRGARR